jgi:hypothetical protein
MPSTERAFAFELCPDGLPAPLAPTASVGADAHAAHHHHAGLPDAPAADHNGHSHGSAHTQHCPYAVGGAALAPEAVAWIVSAETPTPAVPPRAAIVPSDARYRAQQPRGPPALA